MSGSASISLEQAILGHTLGYNPMPFTGPVFVALCALAPAPTEVTGGVEVSGGGYARTQATFALVDPPANLAANTAAVEFPTATTDWGTVGFFELWDKASGGDRLYWGALVDPITNVPTNITVTAGEITRFSPGTLAIIATTEVGGTISIGAYLPLVGGTLTGPLTLAADPATALQAATRQYVDGKLSAGAATGYINVLNYNADPTGVADSTAAFRAALAVTPSKSVYVPAGTYYLTDTLTVGVNSVNQRLFGDGGASILRIDAAFNSAATAVIILSGTATPLTSHPTVEHLRISFAVPTDITATVASASGTSVVLTAPVPAGVVVGDYVTDNTDWLGIQVNSQTTGSTTPTEGSKVANIAGSTVTLSLPVVAAHIAAGHQVRFGHPRSMFRALSAVPGPSTGIGGYMPQYPWAIYIDGPGVSVIDDIHIEGAYNGIYCHAAENFRVTNCRIGAFNVGLDIDNGGDGGFVDRIWYNAYGLFNPAATTNTAIGQVFYDGATVAANFGRCDCILISNFCSFVAKVNITPNWSIGHIVNMDLDFPQASLNIAANTGAYGDVVQITNFRGQYVFCYGGATFSNAFIAPDTVPAVIIDGTQVTMLGGSIKTAAPGAVVVRNGATLQMRDMTISGPGSNWSGGLIQEQSGSAVNIRSCSFISGGVGPGLTMADDSVWSTVWGNFWGNATFTPPGSNGVYEGTSKQHASFQAGIDFNNQLGASNTDLSKGINFFGGTYGIGITPNRVNVVSTNNVVLMSGSTDLLTASPSGVLCSVPVAQPAQGGMIAAGTNAGTATVITAAYSNVNTTPTGTGVVLPTGVASGRRYVIWNHGANALSVYPGGAETILGFAGIPLTVAAAAKAALVSFGGTWLQED